MGSQTASGTSDRSLAVRWTLRDRPLWRAMLPQYLDQLTDGGA